MRLSARAPSAGLVLALLGSTTAAEAKFVRQDLRVPGTTMWVVHGDVDGDGGTDIVLSYRRGAGPESQRFIAVFFRGDSGYSEAPNLAYAAPKNAAVFDLGDALPSPGEEIVYLAPDGMYAQAIVDRRAGAPTRIVRTTPLVARPEEEDLATFDFLRTLSPGAPPAAIIPTAGPLRLFRREGSLFKPAGEVQIDALSFYDAGTQTYRRSGRGASGGFPYTFRATTIIPVMSFVDQTGDGLIDVVTTYEDRVAVFPALADGTISSTASYHRWFQLRTSRELAVPDNDIHADVADFDGDGVADISFTKMGGGITTMRTETMLYRGMKGGGFDREPLQSFKEDGFATLIKYLDVDGDGKLEMVHPYSEVSVVALSKMLISKELTLDLRIRRRSKEPGRFFETKPTQTLHNQIALDFAMAGALRGTYPLFGHDFDGDGKKDVVLAQGGDSLVLHRAASREEGEIFEEDGRLSVSAPATKETYALPPKAGASGPADLLLVYVDRPEMTGKMIVFLNQR